jgi:hypothetical protein
VKSIAAEAAGERLVGARPSRMRAFAVASLAAFAAGTLVYKLLRSSGGAENGD